MMTDEQFREVRRVLGDISIYLERMAEALELMQGDIDRVVVHNEDGDFFVRTES
jgi:hypothetical protein